MVETTLPVNAVLVPTIKSSDESNTTGTVPTVCIDPPASTVLSVPMTSFVELTR